MIYSISGLNFPAVEIKIKENGNFESRETYSISFKNHDVANCGFIASNQNIYHDNGQGLIFSKNHGYTYDFEKEKEENLWEIMRITEDTEALEGPALNYDVVTKLKVGDLIIKTKETVNDHNRISWDKIRLPNGTETYIDSTKITKHTDDYTNLEFENYGKKYNVYFSPSVKGINLEDYPYYIIKNEKNNDERVNIYFSKSRIYVTDTNVGGKLIYGLNGISGTFGIKIDLAGGFTYTTVQADDFDGHDATNCGFIASNQNIYLSNGHELVFSKNHGYTYDFEKEGGNESNDVVEILEDTIVLDGPALNYDEIGTLKTGDICKRVKAEVNYHNRTNWDKILLNNGKEVYIFSNNIAKTDDYNYINFNYNSKEYNVYFPKSKLEMDLDNYPYYAVKTGMNSSIEIYYSTSIITASKAITGNEYGYVYYLNLGKNSLSMKMNKDGFLTYNKIYSSSSDFILNEPNYGFIASNQDIYKDDELMFFKTTMELHGREVFELVKVKGVDELPVKLDTSINSPTIYTLVRDQQVIRVLIRAAFYDGIFWDKVRLDNGKEGYVNTLHLDRVRVNAPVNPTAYEEVSGAYGGESSMYSSVDLDPPNMEVDEYSKMCIGEYEYNTNKYEFTLYNLILTDKVLSDIRDLALAASVVCANNEKLNMVDAGNALEFFLTKGKQGASDYEKTIYEINPYTRGHLRREFNGPKFLEDSNNAKKRLNLEIGKAINAAEKFTENGKNNISFINKDENRIKGENEVNDSTNWFATLGDYRIYSEANVTKDGTKYTMDITYHLEDYYDWRDDDDNFSLTTIMDIATNKGWDKSLFYLASYPLWQMNVRGFARNYTNHDEIKLNVTWEEGQNVDSGANISFKN